MFAPSEVRQNLLLGFETTNFRYLKQIENETDALTETANNQYVVVYRITRECLEVSRKRATPFRYDYFQSLNMAILRVCMPSTLHNLVTSTFKILFDEQVAAMAMYN
jgi:hypothetical protein